MGPVTQEDPIGIAGGLNLYGYANGDPINFSDPFGLCANPLECLLRGIARAVLGSVGTTPEGVTDTFENQVLPCAAQGGLTAFSAVADASGWTASMAFGRAVVEVGETLVREGAEAAIRGGGRQEAVAAAVAANAGAWDGAAKGTVVDIGQVGAESAVTGEGPSVSDGATFLPVVGTIMTGAATYQTCTGGRR